MAEYEVEFTVEDMRSGNTLMYAKNEIESNNDYKVGDRVSELDYLCTKQPMIFDGVEFSIDTGMKVEALWVTKGKSKKRLRLEFYIECDDGIRPSDLKRKLENQGWSVTSPFQ